MTDKELSRLNKKELIEIICQMEETNPQEEKELSAKRVRRFNKTAFHRTLRSTAAVLIVVAAVSVLIATLLMPVLQIHGSSMFPTLESGQIVVSFKGSDYKAGDLVAFYYGNKLLVKRVVAGPGDWINIEKNGDVYVNGKVIKEPYITEKAFGDCDMSFPLQIGDERWFLMGDNRAVSVDSRVSLIGTVSEEQIVGKIILRIWPLKHFGSLK